MKAKPKIDRTIIVALILSIGPMMLGGVSIYQARQTHNIVNSRMDELLAISKKAAGDAATLEEKKAQKNREDGRKSR